MTNQALLEAASEMLLWIDTYDDAMGHGYCATQSGEPMESCTCGFTEMRERWESAIKAVDNEKRGGKTGRQVPMLHEALYLGAPDILEVVGDRLGLIVNCLNASGYRIVKTDASGSKLAKRIKNEPFFPNADGPMHGNATAFRDYQRRILNIVQEGRGEE